MSSPRWSIAAISKSASTSLDFSGKRSKGARWQTKNKTLHRRHSPRLPLENASGLRDKRIRPEGVVPKQAQGYVVAGLAVLILMAVMFSKNHAKPGKETARPLRWPCLRT